MDNDIKKRISEAKLTCQEKILNAVMDFEKQTGLTVTGIDYMRDTNPICERWHVTILVKV